MKYLPRKKGRGPNTSPERRANIEAVVAARQRGLTVVLEDIYDPHNALAVARSCEAFGVQEVHLVFQNVKKWKKKTVGKSTSSSARKWLDFTIHDSPDACREALSEQGYRHVATALSEDSTSLFKAALHGVPLALWMGNEHEGLSQESIDAADERIVIPMSGMLQSLNLSVSAGICLFEITRQRREAGTLQPLPKAEQQKLINDFVWR